jgi:LAO/AO transport system kinase
MEHSHLVVVNKADGDLMEAAMRMQYEYTSSLKFMRPVSPNWRPKVLTHTIKSLNQSSDILFGFRS